VSEIILHWGLTAAQMIIALAMAFAAYRIVIGPRAQDRVLALDAFYVAAMLMLMLFGIRVGSAIYFEVALIIGILGFVGTVALAKFLMRGEVIE
jgi:multicomponent K+:H+ antiporter subunit F